VTATEHYLTADDGQAREIAIPESPGGQRRASGAARAVPHADPLRDGDRRRGSWPPPPGTARKRALFV
jgi:hypothetical protein